jgi:malonyl-CoA O-methyltransferase
VDDNFALDKRLLRQSFERSAAGYDAAAVLQREVCQRMTARLDFIKHEPRSILDAGSGTGGAIGALRDRYARAAIYALDIAQAMVRRARARSSQWQRVRGRGAAGVCGDMEQLPLRAAAVDMVWSNLALQWMNEPPRAFAELRRVLSPGGLLMFSTFGPDTLKELRAAYQGADGFRHVNRFIDMHDLGDMLMHGGFANPVMDMEYLTLTYADVRALMRDLKSLGAHNVAVGRRSGLAPRATLAAVERNYEVWRRDGRLPATFEVIYGHAWVPMPRTTAEGKPIIPISTRSR